MRGWIVRSRREMKSLLSWEVVAACIVETNLFQVELAAARPLILVCSYLCEWHLG